MIKSRPKDFIVVEEADLILSPKGDYRVYLLKKNNWNTLDLLNSLSRELALPLRKFSYGGKKDKHGLTYQFIAIQDNRDHSRQGRGYSLEARGFMPRPMGPDLIEGNAFTITIRDLDDPGLLERNIAAVKIHGFPNFFDDQRFRSYSPERGFFAEKILREHWNGALQVYFTSVYPETRKDDRERKEAFFRNWRDWETCLSLARNALEKRIFGFLNNHPDDFPRALHLLPEEEISMLYAAFQSHLWNEVLRKVIRQKVKTVAEVEGPEGGYLFWTDIEEEDFKYFRQLEIPTAAPQMSFPDDLTRTLFDEILKQKGLRPGSFRTKILRKAYFKSFPRKALILPDDLKIIEKKKDELHEAKQKMTVSFFLPRGSYGTMLVKRICLPNRQST